MCFFFNVFFLLHFYTPRMQRSSKRSAFKKEIKDDDVKKRPRLKVEPVEHEEYCPSRTPMEQVKAYMEALYNHLHKWLHLQALLAYFLHGDHFVLSVLTQPNEASILKTSLQVLKTPDEVDRLMKRVSGFQRFLKVLLEVFPSLGKDEPTDLPIPFTVAFTVNDFSMRETHVCVKKFNLNMNIAFKEARGRLGAWEELRNLTKVEPGKSRMTRFTNLLVKK